tara:strand:- start:656 stop:778 length:123 start_codon:yes stop_codon:yes gene_type:complete
MHFIFDQSQWYECHLQQGGDIDAKMALHENLERFQTILQK